MREPQYFIAQGQDVQGPFDKSRVLKWIQAGRARPEMLYSLEGGDWRQGHQCPELFPPPGVAPVQVPQAQPAVPYAAQPAYPVADAPLPASVRGGGRRRRRGYRGGRSYGHHDDYDDGPRGRYARPSGPPGEVTTVVFLDFITGALYGLLAGLSFLATAAIDPDDPFTNPDAERSFFLLAGIVFTVFCIGYIVLGLAIRGGSGVARTIHIMLSCLGLLFGLRELTQGLSFSSFLQIALPLVIILLLLSPNANAFFGRRAAGRGGRRMRGGRGRRRRY